MTLAYVCLECYQHSLTPTSMLLKRGLEWKKCDQDKQKLLSNFATFNLKGNTKESKLLWRPRCARSISKLNCSVLTWNCPFFARRFDLFHHQLIQAQYQLNNSNFEPPHQVMWIHHTIYICHHHMCQMSFPPMVRLAWTWTEVGSVGSSNNGRDNDSLTMERLDWLDLALDEGCRNRTSFTPLTVQL